MFGSSSTTSSFASGLSFFTPPVSPSRLKTP
jgi:hypothetical protein